MNPVSALDAAGVLQDASALALPRTLAAPVAFASGRSVAPASALGGTTNVAPAARAGGDAGGFSGLVTRGLQTVSDRLLDSQAGLQAAAAGQDVSPHRLMLQLEEARLSFQLCLQIRNRVLESYQELMRMPL